jgi:hypothetical protein
MILLNTTGSGTRCSYIKTTRSETRCSYINTSRMKPDANTNTIKAIKYDI